MEEDFVFLHSSSTFFSWMAVAHIHTSIQKEAFTRSPGFMIINIILRTITLTLMSRHTLQNYNNNGVRYRGSSYIYQSIWATTSFLSHSLSYIPFLLKLTPIYSLVCFLSPWNSKLIIFYHIPCDQMFPWQEIRLTKW